MASSNNNNSHDFYNRLDFDGPPPPPAHGDSDSDDGPPQYDSRHPQAQQPYDPHLPPITRAATSMDPRHRTPSPGHALAGYQRDEEQPYRPQRQNTGGYPAGAGTPMPAWPDDGNRLMAQPTVSCALEKSTLRGSSPRKNKNKNKKQRLKNIKLLALTYFPPSTLSRISPTPTLMHRPCPPPATRIANHSGPLHTRTHSTPKISATITQTTRISHTRRTTATP